MNAHTPFRLESPAVTDLSRLDLSNAENGKDAAHQLRRCRTAADFEAWARTWGEGLCAAAETHAEHAGGEFIGRDEYRDLEADCTRAEGVVTALKSAMEWCEAKLDKISEEHDLGQKLQAALDDVFNKLEAARTEA